jgi:hypothetical protein
MPLKYTEILTGLSAPRLKTYRRICPSPPTTLDAIKAHFLLNDITQHFYVPIQLIELILRNQTNAAILNKSGSASWYSTLPVSQQSKNAVAEAIALAQREVSGRAILPDEVVCRLMFGFWAYMYDTQYRDTRNSFFWDTRTLAMAFPNKPAALSIATLFLRLKEVNDLRNRLFHHEPIWSRTNISSLDEAISNLKQRYENLCEVLTWLSAEQSSLLKAWGFQGRFYMACDKTRFDRQLW